MGRMRVIAGAVLAGIVIVGAPRGAAAQARPGRPTGRVAVNVDTIQRRPIDGSGPATTDAEVSTWATFESPEAGDGSGVDFRLDMRHARSMQGVRPDRVSLYDAYAGGHFGEGVQVRVRAGHLWLQDLGTMGALAGGLVEVGQPRSASGTRFRVGMFGGREPNIYTTGYAPEVTKVGGYAAVESGYLRRHLVGFTQVRQGGLTERSVLSVTNFVPGGSKFFAYQAAEYEVRGPAQGKAASGLSYFLTNVRVSPATRLELQATYNRGRSIDARTMTADLLNGRALTPQAVEGLRYESRGGRVTVEVARGVRVYGSYAQDRTNRDDALTGRVMVGGYASNLFRSGLDVAASDSRVDRSTGAYHSTYVSIGRGVGRSLYLSGDYTTSLSVIQFLRSDGIVIETRPRTKRYAGSANATLSRQFSLMVSADVTRDDVQQEWRLLSGLSYRIR